MNRNPKGARFFYAHNSIQQVERHWVFYYPGKTLLNPGDGGIMAATRAQENKRIRQEALREQLQAQGHVQHVVDILDKLSNPEVEIDAAMVGRYKITLDTKLKLIDKYLPTEKPTTLEGTGDDGEIVIQKVVREVVKL